eukprot:1139897-Pelagomonas_calceolata.AAC.3
MSNTWACRLGQQGGLHGGRRAGEHLPHLPQAFAVHIGATASPAVHQHVQVHSCHVLVANGAWTLLPLCKVQRGARLSLCCLQFASAHKLPQFASSQACSACVPCSAP